MSTLTATVKRREELTQILINVLNAVSKKTWRKKTTHGKANACGLTAAELAEREKAEEIKRGKAQTATLEDVEEDEDKQSFLISDSPPPISA